MPRKQNGFGKPQSFAFKDSTKINKGKSVRGSGSYPSIRTFGSTITRTPVDDFNLDSNWSKWRRGYELFTGVTSVPKRINIAVRIFPDLETGLPVNGLMINFSCVRYLGKISDNSMRYSVRRSIFPEYSFGTVSGIDIPDDPEEFLKRKQYQEVWSPIKDYNPYVKKLQYERLRSSSVSPTSPKDAYTVGATLKTVLTADKKPAIFNANTDKSTTVNKVTTSATALINSEYVQKNGGDLNSLVGQVAVYSGMPAFLPADQLTFEDDSTDITVNMKMTADEVALAILNVDDIEMDELFMSGETPVIYRDPNALLSVNDNYKVRKEYYQPYWGKQYFAADLLEPLVDSYSFTIPPLYIESIKVEDDKAILSTVPYESKLKLFTDGKDNEGYLVWSSVSFTKTKYDETVSQIVVDDDVEPPVVSDELIDKYKMEIEVDPYMDQTWINGDHLFLEESFACNCPSYTKGMVTAPQEKYGALSTDRINVNRQIKYPLPSTGSNKDKEGLSYEQAGTINSWRTRKDQLDLKMCKHTIAEMFSKNVRVIEPKSTPIYSVQEAFSAKLLAEKEVRIPVSIAAEREEISQMDLLFAIGQLLLLSDTEMGSIMNTNRPFVADTLLARYINE